MDRWGRNLGVPVRRRRTWTRNDATAASNPGGLTLCHEKLRALRPDLYRPLQRLREMVGLSFPQRTYLEEQLQHGDSRAAVVVSVIPLLVAAYTDEMDCVAILEFPDELVAEYNLREGTRLLTVNSYGDGPEWHEDLVPGPNNTERFTELNPLIADFVSDDAERLASRKQEILADEWQRAYRMGRSYLKHRPGVARDGRPVFCGEPAEVLRKQ
ncbi:MAG: hypothetical protein P4L84_34150 [Isosphaeraceae bacterium]|nr:hypothetical protein [Isosphaeraceae bacterium]